MTDTTDAPSRAFSIIREVLATPTTATADTIGDKTAARIEQRLKAAGLLVDAPTEEQIERAARALASIEPGEDWPTNAELGGSLTGTRDDEYRDGMREMARAALTAAGVAPQEPSAVRCPACDVDPAAPHNGEGDCPPKPAPSPDREKLWSDAETMSLYWRDRGETRTADLIDALAAQPLLDPEKVAEEYAHADADWWFEWDKFRSETGADPGPNADYIARSLCEAAKRGELSA